jgi:tetratricopeptide (TPR) repeat protein
MDGREANHNLAEIHAYLGLTFAAFGCHAKAEEELRAALIADFDLASYHAQRGRKWSLAGDDQRAAAEFAVAISTDPDHVRTRIELGAELAALGRVDDAIEQFEAASRLEPDFADVHYQLGLLYDETGRAADAEASFLRALTLNPEFALARASLALHYLRCRRDQEALVHYEQTLRGGLRSADIYLSIATIHRRQGDLVRATNALRRGAEINPDYAPIHYNLGRVYQERGQREQAYAAWRRFFACTQQPGLADRLDRFRAELTNEEAFGTATTGGADR